MTFGRRLRELRLQARLSQESLADQIYLLFRIKTSKDAISRMENDVRPPTYEQLVAFAQFFDVSMDFMSGGGSLGIDTEFDEVMEIRESMRNNPDMKLLFSLSKNAPVEDVKEASRLLRLLKETRDSDDT
jgi:transcriptional regulator with XRE-family HTH domain